MTEENKKYYDRISVELNDLNCKIVRAAQAVVRNFLPATQQSLLEAQVNAMKVYAKMLELRLIDLEKSK